MAIHHIATKHPTAPPSQPQYPTAPPLLSQHPTGSPSQQQYPTAPPLLPQHPTASPSQQQHPTVPPLQVQHPNSQPLDPTISDFNPTTRIIPPSEPREDTMKSYIDFMARRELIANKIEKFDDQPGNYHIWKESFQNMIRHVHITPSEEHSLVQQLRSAYIKNPAKGVKEVLKRLDERFGSSIVVTKAHLDKLTQFPKIGYRDAKKL